MKRLIFNVCVVLIICLVQAGSTLSAMNQQQSTSRTDSKSESGQDIPEEEVTPAGQVLVDGRPVLRVYEPVASLTSEARAQGIEGRIVALARETSAPVESMRIQPPTSQSQPMRICLNC
jgi:hypothetical protein